MRAHHNTSFFFARVQTQNAVSCEVRVRARIRFSKHFSLSLQKHLGVTGSDSGQPQITRLRETAKGVGLRERFHWWSFVINQFTIIVVVGVICFLSVEDMFA